MQWILPIFRPQFGCEWKMSLYEYKFESIAQCWSFSVWIDEEIIYWQFYCLIWCAHAFTQHVQCTSYTLPYDYDNTRVSFSRVIVVCALETGLPRKKTGISYVCVTFLIRLKLEEYPWIRASLFCYLFNLNGLFLIVH